VDTPRPSPRTNRTRRVPLAGAWAGPTVLRRLERRAAEPGQADRDARRRAYAEALRKVRGAPPRAAVCRLTPLARRNGVLSLLGRARRPGPRAFDRARALRGQTLRRNRAEGVTRKGWRDASTAAELLNPSNATLGAATGRARSNAFAGEDIVEYRAAQAGAAPAAARRCAAAPAWSRPLELRRVRGRRCGWWRSGAEHR